MDFRILGPLEVRTGSGRVHPLTRRKQRLLLAALLLNANQPVSTSALVDWLWGEQAPASAKQNLYSYVSTLRAYLGADALGPRLRSGSGRYLLRVEPGELDAELFEKLTIEGRGLRATDPATAAERLSRALGLWRSELVLDGLSLPEPLRAEADRLQQLRIAAQEASFDARLAVGQHRELLPELEAAARDHPLHESLWEHWMLALYRAGRRADALAVYEKLSGSLSTDLGVDPGPELRRLRQRIVELDPTLTLPGTAERHPRPLQLPTDLRTFTGRAVELDHLLSIAVDGPAAPTVLISAIDGMAGIGKTALAVRVAHQLAAQFPDGQVFIDLHGFTKDVPPVHPSDALHHLLRSVGIPGEQIPPGLDERSALWRTQVAGRNLLIVLDNAATEAQVRPLLPGTAGNLTLITSRRKLGGLDDVHAISLDVLSQADAVSLFVRTASAERVAGQPFEKTAEVVELCGRLPLAIRLAAARFRHRPAWTLEHLIERLRDQRSRLAELEAGQRGISAAFRLSYDQLTEELRRTFRLLGLHPGADFEPGAAAALAGTTADQAAAHLDALLDTNLLQQHQAHRYRFHDLIRIHTAQMCVEQEPEPARQAALTQLFEYYTRTASVAVDLLYPYDAAHRNHSLDPYDSAKPVDDREDAAAWLDAELPNLLGVAAFTATGAHQIHTARLSAILHRHLHTRGHYAEAGRLHTDALRVARFTGDARGEHDAYTGLGHVHRAHGRYPEAIQNMRLALDAARRIGLRVGEGRALEALGHLHLDQCRFADGRSCLEQALEIAGEVGQRASELEPLLGLGRLHNLQGRYQQAGECYERALAIARELGNLTGEITALIGRGRVHRAQGRHVPAARYLERALGLARTVGFPHGELHALVGLGDIYLLWGRERQASGHYDDALRLAASVGDRNFEYDALQALGRANTAAGRPDQAVAQHEQAMRIFDEFNLPYEVVTSHVGLANAHQALGNLERARRHWQQALDMLTELDVPRVGDITVEDIRKLLAET